MTTTGQLSDALAKRAMQVYADTSMGTSGVRGRPLYATSSHWAPQLLLNIRGQLVSNMAEAKRMIFDAPDFMTGVDKGGTVDRGRGIGRYDHHGDSETRSRGTWVNYVGLQRS